MRNFSRSRLHFQHSFLLCMYPSHVFLFTYASANPYLDCTLPHFPSPLLHVPVAPIRLHLHNRLFTYNATPIPPRGTDWIFGPCGPGELTGALGREGKPEQASGEGNIPFLKFRTSLYCWEGEVIGRVPSHT